MLIQRTLIKGGSSSRWTVIGDLAKGDILIENDRIAAVAPALAAADAEIIDASRMVVMPGLINGHLHTWQTALRGLAADWTVAEYMQAMHRGLATHYRPEDIYIANLMGALNQINNGATTLVDWCHNNPTPDHTDAAIQGLDEVRHPGGVPAWLAEAESEARAEAFQRSADAARARWSGCARGASRATTGSSPSASRSSGRTTRPTT